MHKSTTMMILTNRTNKKRLSLPHMPLSLSPSIPFRKGQQRVPPPPSSLPPILFTPPPWISLSSPFYSSSSSLDCYPQYYFSSSYYSTNYDFDSDSDPAVVANSAAINELRGGVTSISHCHFFILFSVIPDSSVYHNPHFIASDTLSHIFSLSSTSPSSSISPTLDHY